MPTGSRERGFTYLFVLMLIGLLGLGLAASGTLWQTESQREREAELLFIGAQYRQAIKQYYEFEPNQPRLPQSVDDLLADNRRPVPVRHLRKRWRDPFGGELHLIQAVDGSGFVGVHSASKQTPLKRSGFPPAFDAFTAASTLADWRFEFQPPARANPAEPASADP